VKKPIDADLNLSCSHGGPAQIYDTIRYDTVDLRALKS